MTPTLVVPSSPPGSSVASWQRLYRLIGFQKGYNFVLWCIFGFGFLGFTLARVAYLDYFGVFCREGYLSHGSHAAPGECYYFLNGGKEQVGMMLHIYSVIPGCLLLFFQFIPVIRQRFVLFHRINGYLVLLLMSVAVVGGLMATSGSFGGDPAFQTAIGVQSTLVVTGLTMAMVNIKRLQIEEHRAWMLRAWAWALAVITMRILQLPSAAMVSGRGYVAHRPCGQIASDGVISTRVLAQKWPDCAAYFSGQGLDRGAIVAANSYGLPTEVNVALSLATGACAFLALLLHTIGVEIYLYLTPAETERLRHISYHKQLAAGMQHPGRAGLTVDRFGDAAKWRPRVDEKILDMDGGGTSRDSFGDCRKE